MASALCLSGGLPARAQPATVEMPEKVVPLDVTVNGISSGIWPVLDRGGILYAPTEAFASWRVQTRPEARVYVYRGLPYLPLNAVAGLTSRIDPQTQQLVLGVDASSFAATKLTRELTSMLPRSRTVPAFFANYDLNYSTSSNSALRSDLGLLGEAGWSAGPGVFTQTFVGRQLQGGPSRELVRLQTSFRHDFAQSGYTLQAGDSVLRTGQLGRAAYFGGLQFGTNFDLAPYLNRQPVPLVVGETAAPSSVQLYVNNVLRQTSNVPAGPFTLDNLPTLTGNGQVTVRVRDILGRETLITQPFLVTSDLLAPGLDDWSVEIGALRENIGSTDTGYGQRFAAGMWRHGLSTALTLEGRAEAGSDLKNAGVAAVQAVGASWLARAAFAASRERVLGDGWRWSLGADRPDYHSNFNVTVDGYSRDFRTLGEDLNSVPVRLQLAAQASWTQGWGRIGVGVAVQRRFDNEDVATYSLNYSKALADHWQLSTYYTRAIAQGGGYTVGGVLTIPLDRETTSSVSLQSNSGQLDAYTAVSHVPAAGSGLAWRALASHQQSTRAEGGAYYIGRAGQVSADVSTSGQQVDLRLGAAGGLLWTESRGYVMPRFDTSAALIEVPGYPGVGVGLGGQVSVHTDAAGFALLPRLSAYNKNPIRLDPNDLPISAEIDTIEQEIVPAWRSVARVTFPVRGGRGALLRIELDDGAPAPPGALVHIANESREFYVARRGEAYVTGLQDHNRLILAWDGATCELAVDLPPGTPDTIARVGPLRCAGVAR